MVLFLRTRKVLRRQTAKLSRRHRLARQQHVLTQNDRNFALAGAGGFSMRGPRRLSICREADFSEGACQAVGSISHRGRQSDRSSKAARISRKASRKTFPLGPSLPASRLTIESITRTILAPANRRPSLQKPVRKGSAIGQNRSRSNGSSETVPIEVWRFAELSFPHIRSASPVLRSCTHRPDWWKCVASSRRGFS